MNIRQKSKLLFQFIIIVVLITSCDKTEPQSLSFYDDYREVPIHGTVMIGPKTGSGNYTLEVQNPFLLSAEVENGWSSPSGMIAVRGLLTGKTALTVTDNATNESQKIRIKITDNYETLGISESILEDKDAEFPPTLKNIEFIVLVNNKERSLYLINRERISLTDYVLKVRGKGNYHFMNKDDGYHMVLSYPVDEEKQPALNEISTTHVTSSYMLEIPDYALHRLNQNLNLGFETSMPERADEIVRLEETVIQMEEAEKGYKLQSGLTIIEMPVGFL